MPALRVRASWRLLDGCGMAGAGETGVAVHRRTRAAIALAAA
jgi:hypothetical protein